MKILHRTILIRQTAGLNLEQEWVFRQSLWTVAKQVFSGLSNSGDSDARLGYGAACLQLSTHKSNLLFILNVGIFLFATGSNGGDLKVLLLENISTAAVEQFRAAGYEVESHKSALEERELVEKVRGAAILGVRSKTAVSKAVIQAGETLVAVGAFCIGVDKIDRSTANERGIAVFNDPHSNSRSVAELAMGEIIMLLRRTFQASTAMHNGAWNKSAAGAHEVRGLTLGIVGYGKIGSQLSDLAEAMGMRAVFYDVSHVLARGNAHGVSFRELLETSDVVTLHVDGKKENQDLFGAEEFAAMKNGACFLNLSRGFVVDHEALAACLKSGKIAGAAIDVFPKEPESGGGFVSPLQRLPNVILTPHVGGSTEEAQQNIGQFVSEKLMDYVRNGRFDPERESAAMPSGVRGRIVPADAHPSQRARDLTGD